jgi:uncharacterized membrane protein YkvA (DUF1232 family)
MKTEFPRDRRLAGFGRKMRAVAGRIPFAEEAIAAYYCALDPATPARVKAVLIGALAYFIMPADMIPDIIAGLGYTDDAAVFWAAWQSVSNHVSDFHRARARAALDRPALLGRD